MFDKTIEKIINKSLPGVESRLHLHLSQKVDEAFGKLLLAFEDRVSGIQNSLVTLDGRLTAEQAAINTLGQTLTEVKTEVDALPGDYVTVDNIEEHLENTGMLTKDNFDPGDFNILTSDDFNPSDYDLITSDDVSEKVTEVVEEDDFKSSIVDAFMEKLSEALKAS